MSTKTNIVTGSKAIEGMTRGIKIATEAIRLSYGPKGLNAAIEADEQPFHLIANDCETILQAIEVEDPLEKMGLSFLKELSAKANKDSGDGRKTTCIIAEEILDAGRISQLSGMELKRELDALIPIIEQEIDKQTQSIEIEDIGKVAEIAGESKEIGEKLGEIYKEIGKEGIIHLENSGTPNTTYKFIEGVRFFDSGYLSQSFAYDEETERAGRKPNKTIYENPLILITKRKIEKDKDIEGILNYIQREGKPLVIFTSDMDSGVASRMVATHVAKVAKICIIKAPTLWTQYVYEDFAKITGATIVEDATGVTFKNLELKHLGTCGKIVIDKDETTVIGIADITDHLAELTANGDIDSLRRLSWLQTKTAILYIGANNESELSHKRLKYADAINSCRLALKSGVVKGGGVCLANLVLPNTEIANMVGNALCAPHLQLRRNGGITTEDIWDASAVMKNAVRNAISLASIVLTTGIVISLPPKPEQPKHPIYG